MKGILYVLTHANHLGMVKTIGLYTTLELARKEAYRHSSGNTTDWVDACAMPYSAWCMCGSGTYSINEMRVDEVAR